jgi:hypothetical protein
VDILIIDSIAGLEFFDTVEWDPAIGGPTKRKLEELGIVSLFS